ncbi:MAG: hypothetical protein AB7L13_00715 [Acidimicrobiia bacterium]
MERKKAMAVAGAGALLASTGLTAAAALMGVHAFGFGRDDGKAVHLAGDRTASDTPETVTRTVYDDEIVTIFWPTTSTARPVPTAGASPAAPRATDPIQPPRAGNTATPTDPAPTVNQTPPAAPSTTPQTSPPTSPTSPSATTAVTTTTRPATTTTKAPSTTTNAPHTGAVYYVSTLPNGYSAPRSWPASKPLPPLPANCLKGAQLEDNGVWNCEH